MTLSLLDLFVYLQFSRIYVNLKIIIIIIIYVISLLIFVAIRDLYQDKPIYVPGTLWKVNEHCLFIYPNILIYS